MISDFFNWLLRGPIDSRIIGYHPDSFEIVNAIRDAVGGDGVPVRLQPCDGVIATNSDGTETRYPVDEMTILIATVREGRILSGSVETTTMTLNPST